MGQDGYRLVGKDWCQQAGEAQTHSNGRVAIPCLSRGCGLCAQGKAMGDNQGMEVGNGPYKAQMK